MDKAPRPNLTAYDPKPNANPTEEEMQTLNRLTMVWIRADEKERLEAKANLDVYVEVLRLKYGKLQSSLGYTTRVIHPDSR